MAPSSQSYALSDMDWLHWGVIISTAFFGVTMMQSWTYFSNCNDKWHLRLFITVLVALDFATTCLNSIVLRHYSITNFGTPLYLISTVSTQDVQVILTTVVVFLVQLFLASRVYLLDHSWYAPAFIVGFDIEYMKCH
ncbi:hypothetical protein L208DRAFT_1385446 [Tricholoma matsutake]|nr:hypothetical protein L208DRAFT_1385446 [Tricholoma matsutake 945]